MARGGDLLLLEPIDHRSCRLGKGQLWGGKTVRERRCEARIDLIGISTSEKPGRRTYGFFNAGIKILLFGKFEQCDAVLVAETCSDFLFEFLKAFRVCEEVVCCCC